MFRSILVIGTFALPVAAQAELELSFYGGLQSSPHSGVSIVGDAVLPDQDFRAGWDGRPLSAPPYYGIRATWWRNESFGIGLDFNHTKIYADDETLAATGFDRLEFSDGLNTITVNAYRRWENAYAGLTPYVGGGLGVSMPHVELFDEGTQTFGYQLAGPAVAWMAGASYPINDQWSVFGEYKGTYSLNEVELDTGGTLETDIITNALNVGLSFQF